MFMNTNQQHNTMSIFDCHFQQKGDLSISFSPHRLNYHTVNHETTIDCLMVSSILDADIAATIKRGDLLISLKTRNEEIQFINNPNCTFDHALHILSQSNAQSNRTFRFLRPPLGCTQDYTTYLYDVLDATTATLLFDSHIPSFPSFHSNPLSSSSLPSSPPSSSSINNNGIIRPVPISQPILPPKVEVKALRVKSKAIAEQEERLEQMRTAATIDGEVQKRIEAKNREVVSELLRVREEAKQTELEAKRLAQEMQDLAEAKKRRGMEIVRQERESLAFEAARRQLAEEEAVARKAIAERQELARRVVQEREMELLERKAQEERVHKEQEERERRDLEERNRLEEERNRLEEERRQQEDRIARMLEEHTKQMTMAMEKAYSEIEVAKREATKKAQLDLTETQAALQKATEGQRRIQEELKAMEEERRALEESTRQRLRMEEEAKLIEAAAATAKAEAVRLLAEERETARLLAEERYKIEEDAMKILQAKRLAAAELDLLQEGKLKAELENRKLVEMKQALAIEVLRYEEQRRVQELNNNALQHERTVKKDTDAKVALTAELEVAKETARRAEIEANRVAEALRAMELREAQQAVQETARRAEIEANRAADALRAMELREAQQAVQASLARQAELEESRRATLALLEKESALRAMTTLTTSPTSLSLSKGQSLPHLSHSLMPHGDDNDRLRSNTVAVVSKNEKVNSDSNCNTSNSHNININKNSDSNSNNNATGSNYNNKRVEDLKAELLLVQHELQKAETGLVQYQNITSKANNHQQGVSVPADRRKQRIENESARQKRIDMAVRARVEAKTKQLLLHHEGRQQQQQQRQQQQQQQQHHDDNNHSNNDSVRDSRASSIASTSTNIENRLKKPEITSPSSDSIKNVETYNRESTQAVTENMKKEAQRLSLKAKELNMRRKRLMDEEEKLNIIASSAQMSLDQVEQQQMDWNKAVESNSQLMEDNNHISDEQKR